MTTQMLLEYCLSKPRAMLDYPFGPSPAVFKVGGKMFALLSADNEAIKISLKCEPVLADFLRRQYPSVTPGYHLNKTHWNTVLCDSRIHRDEVQRQIDHAYERVFNSLTKKLQKKLVKESHPRYLFSDSTYEPVKASDEYFPIGIFRFDITRLWQYITDHPYWCLCENVRVADYRKSNNKLDMEFLPKADITHPLLIAEISPGNHSLIDGHHRIEKAYLEGLEYLPAYKLTPNQHSLFITERKAYDAYLDYWNGKLEELAI